MESEKAPYAETMPAAEKSSQHSHRSSSDRSIHSNPNDEPSPLKHETTAQDATDSTAAAASRTKSGDGKHDFLTGWKLFLALSGVTVVMLLAMLDIAIIGTVSFHHDVQKG